VTGPESTRTHGISSADAAARRLDIADLSVSYGGRPALRGVTLPIPAGAITAIVGPSGCGKSTFLASLNRMTDLAAGCVVSGRVLLDGRDVREPGTDVVALRRQVGMIFQRPNPFPLSIRRNLTFPLEHHGLRDRAAREAAAEAALRRVGLWEEVKDRLDAPALRLSGGQQQRLCLARALALDPDVLLMDEPCSALDPMASGVVEDLIVSLRGDYTVVIVTHNLAQAKRIADDVAVFWLQDGAGRLIEHGPVGPTFEAPRDPLTASYVRGIRG
jgi:phosphate transport system ATP-binding protein